MSRDEDIVRQLKQHLPWRFHRGVRYNYNERGQLIELRLNGSPELFQGSHGWPVTQLAQVPPEV